MIYGITQKKTEKRNRKNRDDRGMTLLEVIIAVSIFSISAAILLKGFVTSGVINRKSGSYMEAMTTAQNIMEEIKSKTMEEVSLAFNYPVDESGEARLRFLNSRISDTGDDALVIRELYPSLDDSGKTVFENVTKYNNGMDTSRVTASVISRDGGKTYKFNPRATGKYASKYYFEIDNIKVDNKTFDARIEFDGSASAGYKKERSTEEDKKNDYLYPNISKLNTKTNAIYMVDIEKIKNFVADKIADQHRAALAKWRDKQKEAKEKLKAELASLDLTADERYARISSATTKWMNEHPEPKDLNLEDVFQHAGFDLTLTAEKDALGVVNVKASYVLRLRDYKNEAPGSSEFERMDICPCEGNEQNMGENNCFCTIKVPNKVFYTSDTESTLENIYVFYKPNYNSIDKTKPLDNIVLDYQIYRQDTEVEEPEIQFYVIKQKEEGVTAAQENSYQMKLTIKDPASRKQSNWSSNASKFRSNVKVRTNLDYNIAQDIPVRTKIKQMKLSYQGMSDQGDINKTYTGLGAERILSLNGLDNRETADRIFKVQVEVYESGTIGTKKPLATMEGAREN